MEIYIRLEWAESQEWFEVEGCFKGLDNDIFIPKELYEKGIEVINKKIEKEEDEKTLINDIIETYDISNNKEEFIKELKYLFEGIK